MYENYPEWGPAKNDPDSPTSHALQRVHDLGAGAAERPDDN